MIQLISLHPELDVEYTAIVLLPVRLTPVESVAFKESCMQLLERNLLSKTLILDFSQNTFISASGIGALVTLYKATRSKGIDLKLRNVTPQAMIVLELARLDKIFPIELSDECPVAATDRSENQLAETHPYVAGRKKVLL
jgi:anti-anti-sigma factor